MPVFGEHHPSRAYALTERPGTKFEQGPLLETGNPLDVAVAGEGWIAVQAADGTEAYTRAGDLMIDLNGFLRTGSGLPVMGEGGPVVVPPAQKVEIGADGSVSVIPQGAAAGVGLAQVERIKLVNPAAEDLEKREDGLVHLKVGAQGVELAAEVRLEPGFLEGSNVNAVTQLTEILSLSRQYELQVKLMGHAEKNSEASARLLQIS